MSNHQSLLRLRPNSGVSTKPGQLQFARPPAAERCVGRQRLRERFEMLTKPVDQVTASDPAGCEIEHEALLVVYRGVDLRAVENEEGLHGGVCDPFVAVDKGVALNQREGERSGLLDYRGIQIDATERRLGLGDRRLERAEIANAGCAAGHLEEAAVQVDDLPQSEIAHQARRRYSSSFFCNTRAAILDLLAAPGDDFQAAAERVLRKNEELYRRLA